MTLSFGLSLTCIEARNQESGVGDFPNWTEAKGPRKRRVEPYYASELREGGVRALGAGMQALSRRQLSVFTDQEWNAQNEK